MDYLNFQTVKFVGQKLTYILKIWNLLFNKNCRF